MAKIIIRRNGFDMSSQEYHYVKEPITVQQIIDRFELSKDNYHSRVNGFSPKEYMDRSTLFIKEDIVELTKLQQGGSGGGGSNKVLRGVIVAVAAVAALATGGTAGLILLSAAGLGASLLFPDEPPDTQLDIGESELLGGGLSDVSVSAARNKNLTGGKHCFVLGKCRISPPFHAQPFTQLVEYQDAITVKQYIWVTNKGEDADPKVKFCFGYDRECAAIIREYLNGNPQTADYWLTNAIGFFDLPRVHPDPVAAAAYPFGVCLMASHGSIDVSPNTHTGVYSNLHDTEKRFYSAINRNYIRLGTDDPGPFADYWVIQANYSNACVLDQGGFTGQWDHLSSQGSSFVADDTKLAPTNVYFSTVLPAEKNTDQVQLGLGGFSGICAYSWVFLCDENDPDCFGYFVRCDSWEASGYDCSLITDPEVKIFGNPVTDADGNVVSADVICDPNVEYCIESLDETNLRVEKINQAFHLGLGDIQVCGPSYFGTTPTDSLYSFDENQNTRDKDQWPKPEPTEDCRTHDRVDVVTGGTLFNNGIASGPETIVPIQDLNQYNWIERCSTTKTNEIEVNIAAQLYTQGPTGYGQHNEEIQIQYKKYNTNTWTNLGAGVFTMTGFGPITVKRSFNSGPIDSCKWCVRVRRVTVENKNQNTVDKINFTNVHFFQEDCKVEGGETDYTGVNRIYTNLVSSGQTSGGTLGNYSIPICNNIFYLDQADLQEWEDSGRTVEKPWKYGCNTNPAFQFLHFLLGVYRNPDACPDDGIQLDPCSDDGFRVNAIRYGDHPGNTEALYGLCASKKFINVEKICEWALFCEDNDLKFSKYYCPGDPKGSSVLNEVARAGRATWAFVQGQICPIYDNPNKVPKTVISHENIILDSFKVRYNSRGNISKVVTTFNSDNEELGDTDGEVKYDGKPIQVSSDVPCFDKPFGQTRTINLTGVKCIRQAKRETNIMAARQFFQSRTYSMRLGEGWHGLFPGDLAYLADDLTQSTMNGIATCITLRGDKVDTIRINAEYDKEVKYVILRLPCDEIIKVTTEKIDEKTIRLTEDVDACKMPCMLDVEGTPNPYNSDPKIYGSQPEDLIVIGSARETPAKIIQIVSLKPKGDENCEADITAVDFCPEIYDYEYDGLDDIEVDPIKKPYEPMTCAEISNVMVTNNCDGKALICFDKHAAFGAKVDISINGSDHIPLNINDGWSTSSECFEIEGVPGDEYDLILTPVVIATPAQKISANCRFVLK